MKQFLEVSGIVYDAEANKTRFSLVNYFLHDDGQKEVKTSELAEFPVNGEVSHDEVINYAKSLINPDYEIEVVYSDVTTQITEGIQNGTSVPVKKNPAQEVPPEVSTTTADEASDEVVG